MLFASDLDQTLIYSRKSFRGEIAETDIQLIETLEGKEISFMTNKAINLLKEVAASFVFVPVTTRTVEQYQRISIFQETIIPRFAITSNGGNILENGRADEEWNRKLKDLMDTQCAPIEEIAAGFDKLASEEWVIKKRNAESLFLYYIIERSKIPPKELAKFTSWLEKQGWTYSLQGRKLYFVPRPVNKWNALLHVCERLNSEKVITAGDSLLDLCMLEGAHHAFCPLHGELGTGEVPLQGHIMKTEKNGILASEEILESVLKLSKTGLLA
ncbi:HAD family hydrolase [Metabacillus sp. RGM 3146]|uniref:HAD family hydrolase n=1 Tax=Metabacillus sp. RGM 3146 TaxID=3401092 RepID=UPI003B9B87D3